MQRGTVANLAAAGSNVTLGTAVTLANSFAIVNIHKDGGQYGTDDGVTGDLTTTTNLFLDREAGGADPQFVYWQVVQWTGASVQKISATMNAGTDSIGVTLGSSVAKSRTMIIGNHRLSADVNADDLPSSELLNNNSVIFTRVGTAAAFYFVYYVVEFSDNTDVIHGSIRMLSGENNVATTICSVTTSSAGIIPPGNYNRPGSNCRTTDDNMGYAWATIVLTNSTTVTAQRAATGAAARFPFQVLEFTSSTPSSCSATEPGNSTPRTSGLCSASLPVELMDFNGKNCDLSNCIFWQTATERNNDHFEIEKSNDGINYLMFEKVNSKAQKGNSDSPLDYECKDTEPITGINYYRLKQVDIDKTSEYSPVIAVEFKKFQAQEALSILPNPNAGDFLVEFNMNSEPKEVCYVVQDMSGKKLFEEKHINLKHARYLNLRVPFSKGMYLVIFQIDGQEYKKKLVIN